MAASWVSGPVYDVRASLGLIRVPTLVLHSEGFQAVPIDWGRYLAEHISGARFASLPGNDGWVFTEPAVGTALSEIDVFLGGLNSVGDLDRALAAVLFTDIVGSTERASAIGDRQWRHLLEAHDAVARTVVEQHRGRVVKMTGEACWQPSMDQAERFAARLPSASRCGPSESTFARGYTLAKWSCETATSLGSECTSPLG